MGKRKSDWEVEIWAEDEDYCLPRDDRARKCVKKTFVRALTAHEAKQLALEETEVQKRWPKANAAVFPISK